MRVLLLLCCATLAVADDWPQFRGPTRDGQCAEKDLLTRWPQGGPKKLWVAEGLGDGFSSPAIAGGRIYVSGLVAGNGVLHCLDLAGKQLWKSDYGPELTGADRYSGARCAPTVHDGAIFVYSSMGRFSCFDAKTGELRWKVDTGKRFRARQIYYGLSEGPLVEGDTVLCTPGGARASVVALDRKTGETVWKSALGDKAAYCSPIAIDRGGRRLIVTHLARGIVGLDAKTGKKLWRVAFGNRTSVHPNSPLYRARDGLLFFSCGYAQGCLSLKLSKTGTKVRKVWADKVLDVTHGGLVMIGDHVYGASVHRPKHRWVCLDPLTGKMHYQMGGVGLGSVIAAGSYLYTYGENGELQLVHASPAGHKVVGKTRIKDGRGEHWAHPAISGGRLYIRHGPALVAFEIRAGK